MILIMDPYGLEIYFHTRKPTLKTGYSGNIKIGEGLTG